MKKYFAVLFAVALAFSMISGCAWLKTETAKIETDVKSVDWAAVAKWFDTAITDMQKGMTIAAQVDPILAQNAIFQTAGVCLATAKVAGDQLTTDAQAYAAGQLTADEIKATADTLNAQYKIAANAVKQATAKPVSPAPSIAPVPTTSAPAAATK
jgi:hypothetical protein